MHSVSNWIEIKLFLDLSFFYEFIHKFKTHKKILRDSKKKSENYLLIIMKLHI